MYKKTKITALLSLGIVLLSNIVSSVEGAETGHRQDVEQRTLNYAQGVDLTEINSDVARNWRAPSNPGKIFETNAKATVNQGGTGVKDCGGYTTSSCGLACCGADECNTICKSNRAIAHGTEQTCLEEVQSSACGKSCCGEFDCQQVCLNYRFDACNGYTRTTGEYNPKGAGQICCGKENCRAVECGFNTETTGYSGGAAGLTCCGAEDCHSKECDGQTYVLGTVSNPNSNTKNYCCGAVSCHTVYCEQYVSVNTPTGVQDCCGYDDCRYKECEGTFSIHNDAGVNVACCGISACISQALRLDTEKASVKGYSTFRVTASGGVAGVPTYWEITGSGHILSADSFFDSTGHAYAMIETVSPYNQSITVTVKAVH